MRLPLIEAGEIVSAHGIRGEMKMLTWLDDPKQMLGHRRCRIRGQECRIISCRVQKNCNLIKITGVDTPEAVREMVGAVVELYREDIPGDTIFAAELIDMQVFTGDRYIGDVKDVLDYPGNRVYVVVGEYEYLIPAVSAFVHNIDVYNNRMDVTILEGMRSDEN